MTVILLPLAAVKCALVPLSAQTCSTGSAILGRNGDPRLPPRLVEVHTP